MKKLDVSRSRKAGWSSNGNQTILKLLLSLRLTSWRNIELGSLGEKAMEGKATYRANLWPSLLSSPLTLYVGNQQGRLQMVIMWPEDIVIIVWTSCQVPRSQSFQCGGAGMAETLSIGYITCTVVTLKSLNEWTLTENCLYEGNSPPHSSPSEIGLLDSEVMWAEILYVIFLCHSSSLLESVPSGSYPVCISEDHKDLAVFTGFG